MIPAGSGARTGAFRHSLFDCQSDCQICCQVYVCIPAAMGSYWAQSRGEQCHCLHSPCGPLYSPVWIRANIRRARGLPMDFMGDCCEYLFCLECALCRDGRELADIADTIGDLILPSSRSSIVGPPMVGYGSPHTSGMPSVAPMIGDTGPGTSGGYVDLATSSQVTSIDD
jgi:Cys-rich protein (TIGR01571 family)